MNKNRKSPYRHIVSLIYSLISLLVLFSSCSTDGELVDWQERTTPVRAVFEYMVDNSVRYAVEYDNTAVADSLPYTRSDLIIGLESSTFYLKASQLNGTLRIYRLEKDTRSLETEQKITIAPIVVQGARYTTINLLQFSADAHVQVLQTPETPADSSAIALQFFYGDTNQPERIKVTILAVDQYTLLLKGNKLANVPDSMKTEVAELELAKAVLSDAVELNLNRYGKLGADGKPISKGIAARFFYKITDANGTLIQDYTVTNAEIKITSTSKTRNGINVPFPTYKSAVMQWSYKSAAIPFATPSVLITGDKW